MVGIGRSTRTSDAVDLSYSACETGVGCEESSQKMKLGCLLDVYGVKKAITCEGKPRLADEGDRTKQVAVFQRVNVVDDMRYQGKMQSWIHGVECESSGERRRCDSLRTTYW